MADDLDTVLRKSLDAVDRGRRWAIAGVVAMFVAIAISMAALFAIPAAARGAATEGTVLKVLFVATATEMLFVGCCTVVMMFHVSRMTKAILRAVELHAR